MEDFAQIAREVGVGLSNNGNEKALPKQGWLRELELD
jgi:hypothetical protein